MLSQELLQSPIAILGAGSWGTALALHLSRLGQIVHLWTFNETHARQMEKDRCNRKYLPEQRFPPTLKIFFDLKLAIQNVSDILITVPSAAFCEVLTQLKPLLTPKQPLIWATKGLDEQTGLLLHDIVLRILGHRDAYAVLSGPSFAKEVARGLPTAVVAASLDLNFAKKIQQRFNSPRFRVYLTDDVLGVEIGGATKNVLAIATGISDGMGFGSNSRCALMTRGLAEIMRLGLALGAKPETLIGLTGLGDLVLTCTDDQSRNRRFGILLGRAFSPTAAELEIGQVVEGKRNAELIYALGQKHQIDMPIIKAVMHIIHGDVTPEMAMQELFSRQPKNEA